MTTQEFSDSFDTLLNSYNAAIPHGKQPFGLNEYEKSLFLTKAQEEVVVNFYNGKNPYGDSFESTEEMRRYLESLVKTKVYSPEEKVENTGVSSDSIFYRLNDDVLFITLEQVTYDDESLGCYNNKEVRVYPVTQDEYTRIKDNPFRGPTKYKVIRLDSGNNLVELISKFKIGSYLIKYLSKPEPIILEKLENLTIDGKSNSMTCKLHPALHNIILERAVQLALQSKSISENK